MRLVAGGNKLHGQRLTSLPTTRTDDGTAGAGTHAGTEAVHACTTAIIRLECPLALGHGDSPCNWMFNSNSAQHHHQGCSHTVLVLVAPLKQQGVTKPSRGRDGADRWIMLWQPVASSRIGDRIPRCTL
ncbi:hypothetical protein CCHOA_11850 [Corynebacterium choanae]|uniref:Uncharacterized protein n=1 Tax=Corynebacterium choanae TaxID=1862358 RepID=A0A3G6J9D9_9CORY|nr:hypothetical protein CCHOA_11850 [Corynebacterium choanae]